MSFVFRSAAEAIAAVGRDLGASDWLLIDQKRVDLFADATGDHQWIHVDVERARASDFGGTIVHGFLTLSLVAHFLPQIFVAEGLKQGINYGCEKVRFPAAVRVGKRVRGQGLLLRADRVPDDAVQTVVRMSMEIEGETKPGCVAETIGRFFF